MYLYYGLGGIRVNQTELGNYLGITQVAVSKKIKKLTEKLKQEDLFNLLIETLKGVD